MTRYSRCPSVFAVITTQMQSQLAAALKDGPQSARARGIAADRVCRLRRYGGLRVRLRMGSMADAAQEEAAHGNMDHCIGDVGPVLVVAHEAAPAGHPTESAFNHP